jgi:hypothetical protein
MGETRDKKKHFFGALVWKPPSFLGKYENGIN